MKWIEPKQIIPSDEIIGAYQNTILLAEQLTSRGIINRSQAIRYLDPDQYNPSSPFEFPYMEHAVRRISTAIDQGETIGIWGDFDVDGQTATAVLLKAFRAIGARVRYHIPVRADESHGIKQAYLDEFVRKGVQLLITCDTGISEFDTLTYAKSIGLDVILSDHHTPQPQLPQAYAIINPRLLPESHPFYPLAGVGTAFQIVRALIHSHFRTIQPDPFLDLVALGTVADLAELRSENRFYTQAGLRKMNEATSPALQAVLNSARLQEGSIDESHISFIFAPRLNAAGRLDDANQNVDFLLTTDERFAEQYAAKLEILNNQRKIAVNSVYHSAKALLQREPGLEKYPVILLTHPDWEPGVVGIAASMLVEEYEKPAILLRTERNFAKGSARSIEGVNIIQSIAENHSFLANFGGHPMAAGLSLQVEQIQAFREALSKSINQQTEGKRPEKTLQIDSYLPFANININLIQEIERLSPFGPGNPSPVLVTKNLEVAKKTSFGRSGEHIQCILRDQHGDTRKAIWWRGAAQKPPKSPIDLAYTVKRDNYRRASSVSLEWMDHRESIPESIEISPPKRRMDVFDFRLSENQMRLLKKLMNKEKIQSWQEGVGSQLDQTAKTRTQLSKSDALAILFPPPEFAVIHDVLDQAAPKTLYLFNLTKPNDTLKGFLLDLAGLVKNCLNQKNGQGYLSEFAAQLGHREGTVEMGLKWLQAKGEILIEIEEDQFHLKNGTQKTSQVLMQCTQSLRNLLQETAAFRSFYLRIDQDRIISL